MTDKASRPKPQAAALLPGDAGYLPSPEQIAEACKEIQAGWTPEERDRRIRGYESTPTYEPTWCRGAAAQANASGPS